MPRNFLSIRDLSKQEVLDIFQQADQLQSKRTVTHTDHSKMLGLLFFEESTRTRIGFEAAAWRAGIQSFVMQETKYSSNMSQGETISDTIKTLDAYATLYCIRHFSEDVFEEIIPYAKHPVINCGNGYDEHPTQALIDAYTIWKHFGRLDDITITVIGQAKYSRALHSLVLLLKSFSGITINEISPKELTLQNKYRREFTQAGNSYMQLTNHVWGAENVVYSTGFPPINPSGEYSEKTRAKYRISQDTADRLHADAIVLCPLPRIDEIDKEVDDAHSAHYFKQNELGLYVRMAVIQKYAA